MFPLRDSIPSSRVPLVNLTIIVACVAIFIFELTLGQGLERFLNAAAFIPARLFEPGAYEVGALYNAQTMLFSMQFFSGTLSLATASAASGGVAWFAHIGGFVAGAVLAIWLRRSGRVRPVPRYNVRLE